MGSFLDALVVSPLTDGDNWKVEEPFYYRDNKLGKITVDAGFITDFGSIPRPFWNIISPYGKAGRGFVIHDQLYTFQVVNGNKIKQKAADDCLMRMMTELKVSPFVRWMIYGHLRMWGWIAWLNHKKDLIKRNS